VTPVKTKKSLVVVGLVVAIGCMVACVLVVKRQAAREIARSDVERVTAPEQTRNPSPAAVLPGPNPDATPIDQTGNTSAPTPQGAKADAAQQVTPQTKQGRKPKEEIKDPDARAALSLVGADPNAEQYWIAAINDSRLPAHERQDLIEDLNEDGLSDPKNPGLGDLPLIVNRLQLIEELAPNALDTVNADAFAEAYKDLANMFVRLTQR
jgi:hypothetical protein